MEDLVNLKRKALYTRVYGTCVVLVAKKDAPDGFAIWICNWCAHIEGRIEDSGGHRIIKAKSFVFCFCFVWKKLKTVQMSLVSAR